MKILSEHYTNLVEYGLCKGLIKPSSKHIFPQDEYIPATRYLELFSELWHKSKDPYFGLHFGFYLNIKALKSIYNISMASTSIEQVVSLWADYAKENFPLIQYSSYKKGEHFYIEIDSLLEESIRFQILDTIAAFSFRELKLMLGSNNFIFSSPQNDQNILSNWFGQAVRKSKKYTFKFDNNILHKEINKGRKKDLELILPKFLSMISKAEKSNLAFSASVRLMILNMCNPELPTLHQVAVQFNLSERSFQRKLKKESMSFRQITNDIKQALFYYLNLGKSLKTEEIAFLLGFSSSSALLHAKQNWEGKKIFLDY